jgi:predicted HAD superfamily Cof-like phosphohydrolase
MMAIEEFIEWLQAHVDDDLIAAADAWADRSYVLVGDVVAAGLPAAELHSEVHRSAATWQRSRVLTSLARRLKDRVTRRRI